MFKKLVIKSTSQIRSSDQRKLKAELAQHLKTDAAAIEKVLPGSIAVAKSMSENAAIYTANDANPVFVRIDRGVFRDEAIQALAAQTATNPKFVFAPTIHALFLNPKLLACIRTNAAVAERLHNGADLMLPGVYNSPSIETISRGQIVGVFVAVQNQSNEVKLVPVAVALSLMDGAEMIACGMKGKGFVTVTTSGDALFQLGREENIPESAYITPDQFTGRENDEEISELNLVSKSTESQMESEYNIMDDAVLVMPASHTSSTDDFVLIEDDADSSTAEIIATIDEISVADDAESLVTVASTPLLSSVEVDAQLCHNLLSAIKTSLPDDSKAYPMSASTLYSTYILPQTVGLDLKASSYKKLSKFLKAMERKEYLKLKERQGGELVVTSINALHPEVIAFEDNGPRKRKPKTSKNLSAASAKGVFETIQTTDVFKSKSAGFHKFFEEVGYQKDALFTHQDIKSALDMYIKNHDLNNKENPRLIKIDATLASTVLEKDEYTSVDFLTRDAIFSRLCEKMAPFHLLIIPSHDGTIIRKGSVKPIRIQIEKRSGNKLVTRISHLELFLIDPETLATQLKIPCASSTAVNYLQGGGASGTPITNEVIVQGNKVHEVCVWLRDNYRFKFGSGNVKNKQVKLGTKGGLQCKYIEVVDRT